MVKIRYLLFKKSITNKVVEHRIRIVKSGTHFDYGIEYDTIQTSNLVLFPLGLFVEEVKGPITLWITAVDRSGNESDYHAVEIKENIDVAKLSTRLLAFTPSASSDVTEYRIRITKSGEAFAYSIPFAVSAVSTPANGTVGDVQIDISTLSNVPTESGTYDVFITAADAAGNESDPLAVTGSNFDFVAPDAPTQGRVI